MREWQQALLLSVRLRQAAGLLPLELLDCSLQGLALGGVAQSPVQQEANARTSRQASKIQILSPREKETLQAPPQAKGAHRAQKGHRDTPAG